MQKEGLFVSENRRQEIFQLLQESDEPLTGSALALRFHVTRQIIVKDIERLHRANAASL